MKGKLVLIGGGEDTAFIFNYIFTLAGGRENAKVALIPTASSDVEDTMSSYEKYFTDDLKLPKEHFWAVPLAASTDNVVTTSKHTEWATNTNNLEITEKIKGYNIVFFVGGDQRRYLSTFFSDFNGTPLLKAIKEMYENGAVIAGTSAGSNIMSEISICGGRSEEALSFKIAWSITEDDGEKLLITKGFGLVKNAIVDTHFNRFGRLGRLLQAAALDNIHYGLGIGERTAIVFHSEDKVEVYGEGKVTLINLKEAYNLTNINGMCYLRNILLNVLGHGDTYNFSNGEYVPNNQKSIINNTPYYGMKDYQISLDIFGEFEIEKILYKYMLDNEAREVIGIMDYRQQYISEGKSTLLHFEKLHRTCSYYAKYRIHDDVGEEEHYSGTNIRLDIYPMVYEKAETSRDINAVLFAVSDELHIVVYDNETTRPCVDTKIELFNSAGELIFRRRTDKFGKIVIVNEIDKKQIKRIEITNGGYLNCNLEHLPDMLSYCLK